MQQQLILPAPTHSVKLLHLNNIIMHVLNALLPVSMNKGRKEPFGFLLPEQIHEFRLTEIRFVVQKS